MWSHEGQPATTYQPKSLSELHSDSVFGTAMFLEFFPSLFQVRQVFAREFSQDMPNKEKTYECFTLLELEWFSLEQTTSGSACSWHGIIYIICLSSNILMLSPTQGQPIQDMLDLPPAQHSLPWLLHVFSSKSLQTSLSTAAWWGSKSKAYAASHYNMIITSSFHDWSTYPPNVPPLRNKGFIAGLTKGLISGRGYLVNGI